MFFNKYPYQDSHELNLDWIIATVKRVEHVVDDFVVFNTITWAGSWDASKSYVKWSVVQDNSGDGYLSIQAVPVNVPLTNTDYWVQVANYSALYAAFNTRITNLETAVGDSSSGLIKDVSDIQADISNIQNDISDINDYLNPMSKILCLCDSYGLAIVGPESAEGYPYKLATITGLPVDVIAEGGMGYVHAGNLGHTAMELLQAYSGDPSLITDFICTMGINDITDSVDPTDVSNNCGLIIEYVKANFPKARIHLGVVGVAQLMYTGANMVKYIQVVNTVRRQCDMYQVNYIHNIEYILHDARLLQTDHGHPTNAGALRIASHIYAHLKGYVNTYGAINTNASITIGDQTTGMIEEIDNSIYRRSFVNMTSISGITLTGSSQNVGYVTGSMFENYDQYDGFVYTNLGTLPIFIYQGVVYMKGTGTLTTVFTSKLEGSTLHV